MRMHDIDAQLVPVLVLATMKMSEYNVWTAIVDGELLLLEVLIYLFIQKI